MAIHRLIGDLFKEIKILPIMDEDIELYSALTFPSNHRAPFDRMLIVQAINHVISRDVKFDAYSIQRLWN